MSGGPKKQRIRGAKRTKGRNLSGHIDQIEERTFQDTHHLESVDRTMRRWRAEPPMHGHPRPEVSHLLARLRGAIRSVDNGSLRAATSDGQRTRDRNGKIPASGKTVERTLGGWVYTIQLPGGEILDKRKEV